MLTCREVLVPGGQVIEVDKARICTNSLSVAFKVNGDGSIKRRLVIDLSRWINKFVIPDKYKMSRFQDALSQSSPEIFNRYTIYQKVTIISVSTPIHTA
jgi:hypothetical protein